MGKFAGANCNVKKAKALPHSGIQIDKRPRRAQCRHVKGWNWLKSLWKHQSDQKAMDKKFEAVIQKVEPISDSIYGLIYRCSLTLNDGTLIPCATLQSKSKLTELAKRRIREEISGKGKHGGPDPYGQIVSTFAAHGNNINDYDVASVAPSKFAPQLTLLSQIHGETFMGWTGWVFEMKDEKLFAYGSSFHFEFLDLPEGYSFDDVAKVHNHSYLSSDGKIINLERGALPPKDYISEKIFRERIFFTCFIDGL